MPTPVSDIYTGLSEAEVESRRQQGLINTPVKPPSKSVGQIIAGNTFTYFNLVYTVLAILLLSVRSYRDLTFMGVILSNTLIGIIQELRSKRVLDKLTVLHAPTSLVVRSGQELRIPTAELVKDDIVLFKSGDQISADAVVVDGHASVNESLLTGEADEIKKEPDSPLMSGSFIISGVVRARLEKVGAESYISQLTLRAKAMKQGEQSEIIKSLNRLVTVAGILIIPIGALLFWRQNAELSFTENLRSCVAAVMGMIPEGLFLLASITLAISAMRLAQQKVLIHNMKCIESLARVDVLCVDKTGTITDETMTVSDFETLAMPRDELFALLSDFAAAQDADNITMKALKAYFTAPSGKNAINVSGFSSQFKYSGVNFAEGSFVLGAPEFLLREQYETYRARIEEASRKGVRVLAFCQYEGTADGQALKAGVSPLGFVFLSNPVRKTAPETFRYFASQGVEIKVISGDNPVTVCEVAKQAGIQNAERFIDASTLTDETAVRDAVTRYTVFGRVTPDQKKVIVNALQAAGKTVAMTGDGVNDILAMKEADCSVAMASGSDAAVQASQLVLLESDFSKMPSIVDEGRKVVNNLERSGSLYIVKNVFSLMIALTAIFFGLRYPLRPAQITLIGAFTIGIPSFFLAQAPNKDIIRGGFLRNVLMKALPGGVTDAIFVIALILGGKLLSLGTDDVRTASTILVAFIGMNIHYQIAKPMDRYKWIIFALCGAGLVLGMLLFSGLFEITVLTRPALFLCLGACALSVPVYWLLRRLFARGR
ncbi:MAG: HAD-IC family P-type ATPase [Lachnospiraceae bacterium]|nr:HAD-IC family P-type ATPase [Lachnospiraceae bacterium]